MEDPNVYDLLVVVPQLAEQLACDHSFISEMGLDEFSHDEKVQKLSLVIGFVLAMYNTAQSIFKSDKYETLDDKFIELIYSRIHLIPEITENNPEPQNYAKECYREVKIKSYDAGLKWSERNLYKQFFEICVCVFNIMATTFKGVFSEL